MSKGSSKNKGSPKRKPNPAVIVALIGLAGTALATVLGPALVKWIERLPAPTAVVSFTPAQTPVEASVSTLTPVPTPTAWPLGDQTATDPKPLCRITVGDFPEPGRDHARALQFSITGEGGYCSWIVPLHGYNASTKEQLTFWVKGRQGGEQYEVGIKDGKTIPGQEPKVPETASASWTQVSIFLDRFKNQDLASLENVSLNFTTGSGTIYVDQLIFIP